MDQILEKAKLANDVILHPIIWPRNCLERRLLSTEYGVYGVFFYFLEKADTKTGITISFSITYKPGIASRRYHEREDMWQ
ncbi:hypothetical protein MCOR21_008886, partial [Pyricularia oryzae]